MSADDTECDAAAHNRTAWQWKAADPESQGVSAARLAGLWRDLAPDTTALVVIRHDRIIFERYAPGCYRTTPHYTASLAKAVVGGLSLMLALNDNRIGSDDLACKFIPYWVSDPKKRGITVRHLATHTSGIEDAEQDDIPHSRLTGWKGDFWAGLPPPRDPFTVSRDLAPILDPPGTRMRYSNPGMAMLSYCVTASLQGEPHSDLRTLLKHRILEPLGVPPEEWAVGYDTTVALDGLNLVANWGGASISPDALARVGRLMLRQGDWEGTHLIDPAIVEAATTHAGMPSHSGLGWWVNRKADGSTVWPTAPSDAFWGAGAGHQWLFVVPSLGLIAVRMGEALGANADFNTALGVRLIKPIMDAVSPIRSAPYPPSREIRGIQWAPVSTIVRQACDSDCWPLTWADDDHLYTAYGDGSGFDPMVSEKLSLGFARIGGPPYAFTGANIRSPTIEQKGDGPAGRKASGILMVGGTLYLLVRNADNSQLAWSTDRGRTWRWSDWRFSTSFGCPTFLSFGRDFAGARDRYVYVYSPDSDDAYTPADRLVLARVPRDRILDRDAYRFFRGKDRGGRPLWSPYVCDRAGVFQFARSCYRCGVSYDFGLKRYLLCQTIPPDARFAGGFGVYDAPEPWGPWTTVFLTNDWDVGPGETCSFPTKWMDRDGRTLYLVFSGNDCFSVRMATLEVDV